MRPAKRGSLSLKLARVRDRVPPRDPSAKRWAHVQPVLTGSTAKSPKNPPSAISTTRSLQF